MGGAARLDPGTRGPQGLRRGPRVPPHGDKVELQPEEPAEVRTGALPPLQAAIGPGHLARGVVGPEHHHPQRGALGLLVAAQDGPPAEADVPEGRSLGLGLWPSL